MFLIKGKMVFQTKLTLCERVVHLKLITGCATHGSNNPHQAFAVNGNMSLQLCGEILVHSCFQNCFVWATWRVFEHEQSVYGYVIGLESRTLTWPRQNLHWVCLVEWWGPLVDQSCVLWVNVLFYEPSVLKPNVTNQWPDFILKQQSTSWQSNTHPHIYLLKVVCFPPDVRRSTTLCPTFVS